MKISELSVRRPVLMTMVYVLIAIIAAVYISQIDIALIPDTEMPIISVMVSSDCSGASKLRPVREIISPSRSFHSVKS